ncbi:MAG TPA: redoxin domain-containing protein [Fimbriimonadaceae bacterium]|nr:redoxin domain-containing protein [Fimbriimonadaceae bacterium]
MATPQLGDRFIDFKAGEHDTHALRRKGPLVVLFWRTECPVCRLALPFYQRLAERYPHLTVLGVAQNTLLETETYCDANRITFPQVADEDLHISRAYEIGIVPAFFFTSGDGGEVQISGTGWDRQRLEEVGIRVAGMRGMPAEALVLDTDGVPNYKPG